jgi:broad specificity phosphatase PhoE
MPTNGADLVYLARHGRTALNAEGRLRGLSDPPLDEVGRGEAARLGVALAGYAPTVVISSSLQRAVATAQAIGAACHAPVVADKRLNDRDYGPWTGHPRAEVEQRFGSVDAAPGVEPAAEVAARALAALAELTNEYAAGPLVMVSHDAFNSALLDTLNPDLVSVEQHTGCYNQLRRIEGRWRVDSYNRIPD